MPLSFDFKKHENFPIKYFYGCSKDFYFDIKFPLTYLLSSFNLPM